MELYSTHAYYTAGILGLRSSGFVCGTANLVELSGGPGYLEVARDPTKIIEAVMDAS